MDKQSFSKWLENQYLLWQAELGARKTIKELTGWLSRE